MAAERGLANEQWIHRGLAMSAPISLDPSEVTLVPIAPDVMSIAGGHAPLDGHRPRLGRGRGGPPQHEDRLAGGHRGPLRQVARSADHPPDPDPPPLRPQRRHQSLRRAGRRADRRGRPPQLRERCLARSHTILPDKLAATSVRPTIRPVSDTPLSLGGGAIDIYRISSLHSAEMLIVYISGVKLLFNADLFNPGLLRQRAVPPFWLIYSREFLRQVEPLNLVIDFLVGAHGDPGRPTVSEPRHLHAIAAGAKHHDERNRTQQAAESVILLR